ncbi:hypothetical protein H4582DRAFT_2053337 [Lactarius indigo]|nr:hypothetical protein H4582DRAFT_2053337 [Lactarius indigo]
MRMRAAAGAKTTRSCSCRRQQRHARRYSTAWRGLTPVGFFGASEKWGLSQTFKEKEDGTSIPQGSNDGASRGDGDPGDIPGVVTIAEAELALLLEAQAAALLPTWRSTTTRMWGVGTLMGLR